MLPDDSWDRTRGARVLTNGGAIQYFSSDKETTQITRGRGFDMSLACELPAQRRLVQYRRRLCGFGGGAVDSEYGSRRCHRALEPQQTNGKMYRTFPAD